jgi:hypothetical protein
MVRTLSLWRKQDRQKSLLTTGANLINFAPSKLESECRVKEEEFGEQVFCRLDGQKEWMF